MSIKQIGVIGVGGVDGYFGGKLCKLRNNGSGIDISFVARGEHLRAIQNDGLLLSSERDGDLVCIPSLATDDFRRLPRLDLCLVCVKEFDLIAALSGLEPAIGDETLILPLLNGVDVHSRVRTVLKKGIVLPACVYVGTHIERPGKIVQKGGACKILFGPAPERPHYIPHELIELFDRAGIQSDCSPNIQAEIWKKFIFISAYGLVSAAYDKTLGEILQDQTLTNHVRGVMKEACSFADRLGVDLPDNIVELSLSKAGRFPPEAKTSFQRDFERTDKKDERDLFAGSMLRMAQGFRVDIPTTRALATFLEKKKPFRAR